MGLTRTPSRVDGEPVSPGSERVQPGGEPELMDRPDVDRRELSRALDALAAANRWLGGTRVVRREVGSLLEGRPPGALRVLDVGAGGGDVARDLDRDLRAEGWRPAFVLADLHPDTLRMARRRTGGGGRFRFVRLDAPRLPFADRSFDVAFSSTVLHHLEDPRAASLLAELERVTRLGWTVADLRRSTPAYLAVKLLAATLWRDNPCPREDAPASVRRAFTAAEARRLAGRAGLDGTARVARAFPFRLVISRRKRGRP